MPLATRERAATNAGNNRLRIAFLPLRARDDSYETLQSLPRSTWFNCASEVDASVLLEVVQEGIRTYVAGGAPR